MATSKTFSCTPDVRCGFCVSLTKDHPFIGIVTSQVLESESLKDQQSGFATSPVVCGARNICGHTRCFLVRLKGTSSILMRCAVRT